MFLIKKGPFQPKLSTYPRSPNILKNKSKQRSFTSNWYDDYPQLEYSLKVNKAFCFACLLYGAGVGVNKSEVAWIFGVNDWHKMKGGENSKCKGRLHKHFNSISHKTAMMRQENQISKSQHVDSMLNEEVQKNRIQEMRNREISKIFLDSSRYLSRQVLAFRGGGDDSDGNFHQLLSLLSRCVSHLKEWLESRRMRAYRTTYTIAVAKRIHNIDRAQVMLSDQE